MLVQKVEFLRDFRKFKKGQIIDLPGRISVITGDNGSGKSSLLAAIRESFSTPWTRSTLGRRDDKPIVKITPDHARETKACYLDLAKDHFQAQSSFMDHAIDLQLRSIGVSSGEASENQLIETLIQADEPIVIIDEPERGLSIARSHILAAGVATITRYKPATRFIIATHSPQFMSALAASVIGLPSGEQHPVLDLVQRFDEHGKQTAIRYVELLERDLKTMDF